MLCTQKLAHVARCRLVLMVDDSSGEHLHLMCVSTPRLDWLPSWRHNSAEDGMDKTGRERDGGTMEGRWK